MKNHLRLLFILALVTGCGQEGRKTSQPEIDIIPENLSVSEPVFLVKQSDVCVESQFKKDRLDILLNLFLQGSETSGRRNFLSLFLGTKIKSSDKKVISRTLYDEDEEFIPRGNYKYIEVINHHLGSDVTVCPEVEKYDRNTVESAALNASFFITKTHRAVTSVDSTLKLAPVTLSISPKIRTTFRTQKNLSRRRSIYRTNNASYSPAERRIMFLPHSKDWKKSYGNLSFWEVPMVASHEYGHHVFQTLVEPYQDNALQAHDCFGHDIVDTDQTVKKSSPMDKLSIIGAYNEGFADLISFYSLSDEERMVTGVKCLEVSRDVGSDKFFDGVDKIFTNEAVSNFLSPSVFSQQGYGCEQTSFQSIHNIGAVFAHNADKIAGVVTTAKDEKLAIALNWAKSIKKNQRNLNAFSKERYFREIFILFIRTAAEYKNSPVSKELCDQAELSFPSITHTLPECKPEV